MNIFGIAGKYLDQPILVAKFKKNVPYILGAGACAYGAHDIWHSKEDSKRKKQLQVGTTLLFTVISALAAPKIVNKMFNNKPLNLTQIKEKNKNLVDNFCKNNNINNKTKEILNKTKKDSLNFREVKYLYNESKLDKKFLNELIPEPENISSKEIFSEIGRLSVLGFIPVFGGIKAGILGDYLTTKDWKEKIPNKIKEGTYQYLANIFLCNVGAGLALGLMEKAGIHSKGARALGMIGGIVATGIIGGSAIANMISNKLINPIFGKNSENSLYSERKPEALDIGLHVDDIATVAVMSGLKWIEPALPIMYAISGFRAGIGYRNGDNSSTIVNNCNKIS